MTNPIDGNRVFGLIAGDGRLPVLVAQGAQQAGKQVICVGIGNPDPELNHYIERYYPAALLRPGSWIRKLKKHGVTQTIMVGRVAKSTLYTPWLILKYLPDWRAIRMYYWRMRGKTRQTDVLLGALADELASGGVILNDSTQYCQDHMATAGILTQGRVPSGLDADIEFGWAIAKKLGELDIGQAVAVREKEVIAVEAIEGTAEMIKRAGHYCRKGGWILIKTSKPAQDMRFDVPCVGPDTIRSLAETKAKCLVIEADKTIIIDKPQTLELANQLGIAIVGHEV